MHLGNGAEVACSGVFSGRAHLWLAVLGQASGEAESVVEGVEEVCEGIGKGGVHHVIGVQNRATCRK